MGLSDLFTRGSRHQEWLDSVDIQIVVSGVRGKSSTVRRFHDILLEREYNTLAKITGDFPITIENGQERPINREGPRVTLYENRTILRDVIQRWTRETRPKAMIVEHPFSPGAGIIFENQALSEYTMRMFNSVFVKPEVIFFTNIRQDHNDTLGRTRQRIARAFARSVPSGTHVVSGEQHPVIHEYLREELQKRNATITQVDIPDEHQDLIGAETIHGLNTVLRHLNMQTLSDSRVEELLRRQQPTWTRLTDGTRVFNAGKVNDIESTELFRRRLLGEMGEDEQVCPFVFLRRDRRGRTASFVEYINILFDRGLIPRVHIGGAFTGVFARNVAPEAIEHETDRDGPGEVLDRLVQEELPILLMGNTVHPWMRELTEEIQQREEPLFLTDPDMEPATEFLWGPQKLEEWKRRRENIRDN